MTTENIIKNEYGEKIHIKIIHKTKEVFIYHEDCNDEYIPISEFLMDYFINENELIKINNTIRHLCMKKPLDLQNNK